MSIRFQQGSASFTLIELLFSLAIISILATLIIVAAPGVLAKGKRSRAAAEIQAMSTGLDGYKTDNGIYPFSDGSMLLTNTPYSSVDGTSLNYQTNSKLLFQALSGQTNYTIAPVAGSKAYMQFKVNQVLSDTLGLSYVADPWSYSYGYSTGTPNGATTPASPYNGIGFFDLWSTGGTTASNPNTNAWVVNWQ